MQQKVSNIFFTYVTLANVWCAICTIMDVCGKDFFWSGGGGGEGMILSIECKFFESDNRGKIFFDLSFSFRFKKMLFSNPLRGRGGTSQSFEKNQNKRLRKI